MKLESSDALCTQSRSDWHPEGVLVFNLDVRNTHTYFVGPLGIWVHNLCKAELKWRDFLEKAYSNGNALGYRDAAGNLLTGSFWLNDAIVRDTYARYGIKLTNQNGIWRRTYYALSYGNINKNFRIFANANPGIVLPAKFKAHHVFPNQFEKEFFEAGIMIHQPEYLTPLSGPFHAMVHNGTIYNDEWQFFFDSFRTKGLAPPTKAQIIQKARELSKKYLFTIYF